MNSLDTRPSAGPLTVGMSPLMFNIVYDHAVLARVAATNVRLRTFANISVHIRGYLAKMHSFRKSNLRKSFAKMLSFLLYSC